jgi:hypothetical protein
MLAFSLPVVASCTLVEWTDEDICPASRVETHRTHKLAEIFIALAVL